MTGPLRSDRRKTGGSVTPTGPDEKDYIKEVQQPRIARHMVKLAEHILDCKAAHVRTNEGRVPPTGFVDDGLVPTIRAQIGLFENAHANR